MNIIEFIKFYFFSEVFYKKFNRNGSLHWFPNGILIFVSVLIKISTWLSPFILNLITYFNDDTVSYNILNGFAVFVIWIMMSLLDRLTYSENSNKIQELEQRMEISDQRHAQSDQRHAQSEQRHDQSEQVVKQVVQQNAKQNQRSYFSSGDAYRAYFENNLLDLDESSV